MSPKMNSNARLSIGGTHIRGYRKPVVLQFCKLQCFCMLLTVHHYSLLSVFPLPFPAFTCLLEPLWYRLNKYVETLLCRSNFIYMSEPGSQVPCILLWQSISKILVSRPSPMYNFPS